MADLLWRPYRPRPGDVVLDIGAGNGGETFYLAEMVGAAGRVIAIEAAPGPYAALQELVELNGWPQVEALHVAVSDKAGTLRIEDVDHWGRTKDFVLAWLTEHGFQARVRGEGDFVQALYVYASR
ncbi:MAG TPA: FkbM family methyltransferase [Propionibacteriaceae bacterium]|nr:FkbM family methyltransferase [Propionibacteriaceae bacterium]